MRAGISVRAALFLSLLPFSLWAESFFYTHEQGNKYRIISTVHESVYIDRVFSHRAEILNRIAVEVLAAGEGGTGTHRAVFLTAEKAEGAGRNIFQWSREYESEFERDRYGRLAIDSRYYMPVVRDVPVFPNRNLSAGDTWSADGYEMHDFRDSFGIAEPYRIPFTANYTYLGTRPRGEREYPAFSVSYRIFFEPPSVPGRIWPLRILGASDQVVYWDTELGQAAAYEESFRMIFELSDGRTVEYRGNAEAEIYESEIMDKTSIADEIAGDISRLGIEDTSVRIADEGVVISLEDIQFMPDSAVLMETEKGKIDKIAGILLRYPDRDIQVDGHTALAGTAGGRLRLSRERAVAVAEYLIQRQVRSADRIVVRGFGAEKPVADNRTPEGMRKNRRVEITLLEN
ncbi:MAG: OmpA family protein [Spirochaetaceae bacterium]|jgi:outer membrane protein OmpA-like peptidoglycan-associated protein|nr:OmpA family protein [Spirochaetaceae bacterium]